MNKVITNKRVTIIGLGKTGYSMLAFLHAQGCGKLTVLDSRLVPPCKAEVLAHYPDVRLSLGEFDKDILSNTEILCVSPGVDLRQPEFNLIHDNQIPIWGDVELFCQQVNKPIIAITGTNAKSTVTSLVGHLLNDLGFKAAVGGNIGLPALALLQEKDVDYYVLELSSYQLEVMPSLKAEVACILNISPDHLDRYDDFAAYVAAKHNIYRHSKHQVYCLDDEVTYPHRMCSSTLCVSSSSSEAPAEDPEMSHKSTGLSAFADNDDRERADLNVSASNNNGEEWGLNVARMQRSEMRELNSTVNTCTFGLSEQSDFYLLHEENATYLAYQQNEYIHKLVDVNKLNIAGEHNHLNMLAALAIISCLENEGQEPEISNMTGVLGMTGVHGLSREALIQKVQSHGSKEQKIIESLCQFQGLPHRCQVIAKHNAVTWINDSKGTNIGATIAALKGLTKQYRGRIILIAGGQGKQQNFAELNPYLSASVKQIMLLGEDRAILAEALAASQVPCQLLPDLKAVVTAAQKIAEPGDLVLLSPACASFDMFKSFEERGEVFTSLVYELCQ